jgi:hypothetical protein
MIVDSPPDDEDLAELEWENDATSVGTLRYDIHVKKRGASTDVTFGMIAGVHGVLKFGGQPTRREYWALPEQNSRSLYEFSTNGDSGSLVWTNKGEAVGIIIAGWCAMFDVPPVLAATLPEDYWDMKSVPFPRDEEGSINFTGTVTMAVYRPLTLVQSLEMVLEDVGGDWELWVPTTDYLSE